MNRDDLLFYVRKPGLQRVPGGFGALKKRFETATENPSGEWTSRIRRVADADAACEILFGVSDLDQ